jgi:hypothetical protein
MLFFIDKKGWGDEQIIFYPKVEFGHLGMHKQTVSTESDRK